MQAVTQSHPSIEAQGSGKWSLNPNTSLTSLCGLAVYDLQYLSGRYAMEAIRQITQLENNILTLRLPLSFKAKRVEVIVMQVEEAVTTSEVGVAEIRRRPSPKLKGTRIIGNIMTPVVPEADWDVLK
jgi:hypothetical protein